MVQTKPRLTIEPVAPDDEAALREWFALEAIATAIDLPDDPPPCWEDHRAQLAAGWPGTLVTVWLARSAGAVVGRASLNLPTLDNLGNAHGDILVAPDHRRRGVGRELLAHLVEQARRAGRVRLVAEIGEPLDGPSPGTAFAAAAGAVPALPAMRRRLALPPDDAALVDLGAASRAAAGGYDLVQWTGPTPTEWLDDIAMLTGRMSTDAPLGELHLEPEHYDAERIRRRNAAAAARGWRVAVTAARSAATGRLVAFTDILVMATVDRHGWQGDTIVAPEDRGHRLGMLIKVANLELARREHPGLRAVDTFNADSNPYMVSINEAMGFRPLDRWTECELPIEP